MWKSAQPLGVTRSSLLFLVLPLFGIGLLFASCSVVRNISERPLERWKSEAMERLAAVSLTNTLITTELRALVEAKFDGHQVWTGEQVIWMADGTYLVYEYRHGQNHYFPPHLFLARSSDGRWLSSSYHFCRGLGMIFGDGQPESIDEFCQQYAAREFDDGPPRRSKPTG